MGFKQAQTAYPLVNPEKYIGDPTKLLYKSSWEQNAFRMCDNNPNIVRWGYEVIKIQYAKPVGATFKITTYFPDLYLEYFDKEQNFIKEVIEIKPKSQTQPSKKKNVKTRLYENSVYLVNMAKWKAAKTWCNSRGIRFSVLTENSLFKPKRNK
jgi:hypothetical protein